MTGAERAQLEVSLARTAVLERQVEALLTGLAEHRTLLEDARRHRLAQDKELSAVRAQRDGFAAEAEALKARILVQAKNSSNSSTPPSADPVATQRRYPTKPKSCLKPGGQPGHPGAYATFTDDPDEVLEHRPTRCPAGHSLHDELEATPGDARQVIDILRRRVVTEHRVLDVTCPTCAVTTRGTFPPQVSGRVSYGPGVKRAALLASCGGQLPARATRALVDGVYGVKVSTGTMDLWRTGLAQSLTGFDTQLVAALRADQVLGADETPIRVTGFTNAHIHTAQTPLLTRFHLAGRARVDIEAGGVLPGYTGTLTHDCLSSYWKVARGAHQVCWAHLVRELTFFHPAFTPHEQGAAHP